jgi:hypothetical protein
MASPDPMTKFAELAAQLLAAARRDDIAEE